MFSVQEFLDRAKLGARVDSDYALAKVSGVGKGNISNYRHGRSMPDERAIEALCALSGDDPDHVAACIQSMRAANDDAAGLWRRVAARLQSGYVDVILLSAIAITSIAPYLLSHSTAALPAQVSDSPSLYIMLNNGCGTINRFGTVGP